VCHFEDDFAEIRNIFAAPTARSPLFLEEAAFGESSRLRHDPAASRIVSHIPATSSRIDRLVVGLRAQQSFDRAALVHRSIAFGYLVERQD